jgi:hypothetical protein
MKMQVGILKFILESRLAEQELKISFSCLDEKFHESVCDLLDPGEVEALANAMLSFVNNQFGLRS